MLERWNHLSPPTHGRPWRTSCVPRAAKGEVLAELLTDFPERFRDGSRVFLAKPDFAGTEAEARSMQVTNYWLPVGKNHGRIVLTFAGIDSISLAETLEGLEVVVPASERMELEEDAEYIDDLLGCTVFDGAASIGIVTAVDFPTTLDGARRLADAAPLLTVETAGGEEVLIPYVQAFIVTLAVADKRIEMALPSGLLDINRAGNEPEPGQAEDAEP